MFKNSATPTLQTRCDTYGYRLVRKRERALHGRQIERMYLDDEVCTERLDAFRDARRSPQPRHITLEQREQLCARCLRALLTGSGHDECQACAGVLEARVVRA